MERVMRGERVGDEAVTGGDGAAESEPGLESEKKELPPGPLSGVRVVDLTQVLAGPYCTMLLADLGADVVKVESPQGDMMRANGPFFPEDEERPFGGYFQSVNRNKRSIVLDLKTSEGLAQFRALTKSAAILVENYSAGVMDRFGLSYESLAAENPALVYASIRGFGDPRTGESPYVDWPAFDIIAQGMGGFMSMTGEGPGRPVKAGPGIGDLFPAALVTVGILAALRHAEQTGMGQYVDVAMYDAILSMCDRIVYQYSYTGTVPAPQGNSHPLFCPYGVFPTSDGHVIVAAPSDRHWQRLCVAIGQAALAEDARFLTNPDRVRNADEVRAMLRAWTGVRTTSQAMSVLGGRVPAAPVNTVVDIFADPHVQAREMLVELEQPGVDRPGVVAGVPVKLTLTPGSVRHRAPLLGEHTAEILAELELPAPRVPTRFPKG